MNHVLYMYISYDILDRVESIAGGSGGLGVLHGGRPQRRSRFANRRAAATVRPQLRRAVHGGRREHRHCQSKFRILINISGGFSRTSKLPHNKICSRSFVIIVFERFEQLEKRMNTRKYNTSWQKVRYRQYRNISQHVNF